jgi:SAM-dependent methyltransferase
VTTKANYFAASTAAHRYKGGRPYFHPVVIERIRERLGIEEPVSRALDVGCGTGLSTRALIDIAGLVVGVDPSSEMLALAESMRGIHFVAGAAEHIPVHDSSFDVLTLSSVFHWLDQRKFLEEARRVLQESGHLLIYDNAFRGMRDNPQFKEWLRSDYLERYRSPDRVRERWDEAAWREEGFALLDSERYENEVTFTHRGLVEYLLTQSNVIAAVERADGRVEEVAAWLFDQTAEFFENEDETFVFGGPITYLQRAAETQGR